MVKRKEAKRKKIVAKKPATLNTIAIADKIRDLINFIQIKTQEEIRIGEGEKIEKDTAEELKAKLRDIAKDLVKLR